MSWEPHQGHAALLTPLLWRLTPSSWTERQPWFSHAILTLKKIQRSGPLLMARVTKILKTQMRTSLQISGGENKGPICQSPQMQKTTLAIESLQEAEEVVEKRYQDMMKRILSIRSAAEGPHETAVKVPAAVCASPALRVRAILPVAETHNETYARLPEEASDAAITQSKLAIEVHDPAEADTMGCCVSGPSLEATATHSANKAAVQAETDLKPEVTPDQCESMACESDKNTTASQSPPDKSALHDCSPSRAQQGGVINDSVSMENGEDSPQGALGSPEVLAQVSGELPLPFMTQDPASTDDGHQGSLHLLGHRLPSSSCLSNAQSLPACLPAESNGPLMTNFVVQQQSFKLLYL